MFQGFETRQIDVDGATIHTRIGGSGAPVLLLHGYPQTGAMWHGVAAALAKTNTVIVPDLRGYGASLCHDGDFTFRAMAHDQVAVMAALGHDRFDVIAHDRGARTTHRMVLDHPDAVHSVAILDIIPTLDVWRTMDDWLAKRYFHWTFLCQPGDMPARLINADPLAYMRHAIFGLSGTGTGFDPRAMAEYEEAAQKPSVVAAWCGDYTAAAGPDLDHDRADVGRTLPHPCLVLWGAKGAVAHAMDPLTAWRVWFPDATGQAVDAGHFLVEENEAAVLPLLQSHLAAKGLPA